ncbi:MAG TPA: glycosyltransferase, partial [Candidatus Paceibacterota bacterium]
ILSKIFYKILSYLTESKQDYRVANYGIYSKKVIKAILDMKDYIRYFPTMVMWVGFRQLTIEVEHSDRVSGKTSYSVKMLFK